MKIFTTNLARIIYALIFGIFGINHFINAKDLAGFVPSFIPGGSTWVYFIGVILIIASISMLINRYVKQTCLLLSVFLILIVFIIHIPGLFNPDSMQFSMLNLFKDCGLAGGGLILAGVFDLRDVK